MISFCLCCALFWNWGCRRTLTEAEVGEEVCERVHAPKNTLPAPDHREDRGMCWTP